MGGMIHEQIANNCQHRSIFNTHFIGLKSYMSQSNDGIKSDVRGMPESVRVEYEKQRAAKKAAAEEKASQLKVEANAPATAKEGGVQEAPDKKGDRRPTCGKIISVVLAIALRSAAA